MGTVKEKVNGKTPTPKDGATTTAAPKSTAKNGESAIISITKEADKIAEKQEPKMTVQDRFDRLEQFQALERKHSSIKSKSQQLKVLRKANDNTGAEISISANGEKISLNNGAIVNEVLSLLDAKLDKLNAETEAEVLTFEI